MTCKHTNVRNGKAGEARSLQPPDGAGYRRVDRAIGALLKELGATQTVYELRKAQP